MEWYDYLPLLIPLAAILVVVYALFFEKRPPRPPAVAPVPADVPPAADDPETALARLEAGGRRQGAPPDLARINDWLLCVANDGSPDQLGRLARIDPAFLRPLGNTPARLFHAIQRSGGEVRSALTAQRDAVLAMVAADRLRLWSALLAEDPARIDACDERFEALTMEELPGVLPAVLADLAEREADPAWRAVRLDLVAGLPEFHADHPPGRQTLEWLIRGINSDNPRELASAVEALPDIATNHRFDPDAGEAAALRDRLIELAGTEMALDMDKAEALGEGLFELTSLTHVDRAPLEAAAEALLDRYAAEPLPTDLWAGAERLLRRGEALLRDMPFAILAVDRHPDCPVVSAAALLALDRTARRLRILGRHDDAADRLCRTLLQQAPAPVVARLADMLETEPDMTPKWSMDTGNRAALETASERTDLPHGLVDRLKALHLIVSERARQTREKDGH